MANGQDYDLQQDDPYRLPPEYETLSAIYQAVDKAANIRGEMEGQIDGMLRDCFFYLRQRAAEATVLLITAHPKSEVEIFELQKRVAAFIEVAAWVNERLDAGRAADEHFQGVQRAVETPIEDQD